ncbi:MAG TPA: tRNA (adenosine(37)-N6)-threonylcarbamoyltransferase complex dimerization subunit type 1 TsaB [Candidatus Onthousia faecipullorum]|uniref:tRNA (Adenosine(37)-N6)-threonylcarbamoyltransferase complex dimerization subunit type 1 TsaB n=1 Tax=Candidatus Onthousia faecipullorum TaxID=2840887 RepID=A0A9D1GBB0_9FIRM|nr:tRNA (adenosine(37)-N6)-threonylcarbamoyltransferase complex dimerization subunit type 1 TsaB [Candidatus Onthousia faecipullorum]
MRVLYIDTSSDYLYSGIVIDDKLISSIKKKYEKDLSKEALPKVIELFDKADITPKDLDKIIVVNGPGSFTGIRIGITIAKTIGWALNINITPISGLTAMAISCNNNTYKMPLIDARRGYVYGAIYDKDNNNVIEDSHIDLKDLLDKSKYLDEVTVITNNDIDINLKKEKYNPDILKIVKQFENNEGINPHLVNPIYLKKTEAEEKAGL